MSKVAIGCAVILSLLLITTTGCSSPTPSQQLPSATPAATAANTGGETGGSGSTAPSPLPTSSPTPTKTPTSTPTPTATPTPTPTPTPNPTPGTPGPFVVEQIVTLGHETLSGQVCSLTKPFAVTAAAPAVTFVFDFVPETADHGTWTYAYSIPSAGETHDASGKYTIGQADTDGKRLLSMTGSDHVTFKGFDGKLPITYRFNLVPSANTTCPGIP